MTKSLAERFERCHLNAIIFNQREALRTLEEDKATLKKQNKQLVSKTEKLEKKLEEMGKNGK